ncbi:unnamed protein product [Peniophora sp. CBMAI 1063]|nr:unnamed protein product [Peniophora sp. CBMAI 1063]
MLAETTDHDSPAPIAIVAAPVRPPAKKRKRDPAHSATATPAPDEDESAGAVLVSDLSQRPRLTISRHPGFLPNTDGSPYYHTDPLATNRLGFRYVPAGVSSPTVFRTIESSPTSYRVSWEDRSSGLRVTQDGLGLLGEKGFRGARCNAPIREGKWYMEVKIEHGGGARTPDSTASEGAHVRLGWARREAPLHAPCGLDGYSYALRDKTGEKVTLSRPRPYGLPVKSGDVVGMYISLPPLRKPSTVDQNDPAHLHRERIAIEFKGQEYFEALEYPQSKEMIALMDNKPKNDSAPSTAPGAKKSATVKNIPSTSRGTAPPPKTEALRPLPTLEGSQIAFFVNGHTPGAAFKDVYDFLPLRQAGAGNKLSRAEKDRRRRQREGARGHRQNPHDDGSLGYYPFISLFNDARVRINPGPDFEFAPPPDVDAALGGREGEEERTWRPICERYKEYMDEQWALDDLEEEELKRELAADALLDANTSHPGSPRPDSPLPHDTTHDSDTGADGDADEEAREREARKEAKRLAKNEADRARRRRIKAEKDAERARENERKSGSRAPGAKDGDGASARGSRAGSVKEGTPAPVPLSSPIQPQVTAGSPPPPPRAQLPSQLPPHQPPTPASTSSSHASAPPPAQPQPRPTMYTSDLSQIEDEDLRRDIEAERKREAKRQAKNEADRARRRRLKIAKDMAKDEQLQAAIAAATEGGGGGGPVNTSPMATMSVFDSRMQKVGVRDEGQDRAGEDTPMDTT